MKIVQHNTIKLIDDLYQQTKKFIEKAGLEWQISSPRLLLQQRQPVARVHSMAQPILRYRTLALLLTYYILGQVRIVLPVHYSIQLLQMQRLRQVAPIMLR